MTNTKEIITTSDQQPIKKLIQIWYHESDADLAYVLDQHLQTMYQRISQIGWCYFMYRNSTEAPQESWQKEEYQKRKNFCLSSFENTVLFIPCISNSFMMSFAKEWSELSHNPGMKIMPIVMRPTETGKNFNFQPLCSYEKNYQLDNGCKEIVAVIETVIREMCGVLNNTSVIDSLFETSATIRVSIPSRVDTTDLLMKQTLATLQAQSNIVGTRIEEIEQKLYLLENKQHTNLFTKFRSKIMDKASL